MIKHCPDLNSIEICDTNIVSFIYCAYDMTNLLLRNVPSLVEVSIFKERCRIDSIRRHFTQLSCCLSQLEFLELDITGAVSLCSYDVSVFFSYVDLDYVVPHSVLGFQDYNHNGVFPRLENLKHLELVVASDYDQALHHLTYFLKVSPYLQRLVLKV